MTDTLIDVHDAEVATQVLADHASQAPPRGQRRGSRSRRGISKGTSRAALVQALEMVPQAVFFLDKRFAIVEVNAAAALLTGTRQSELRGVDLNELLADEQRASLRAAAEGLLAGRSRVQHWRGQLRTASGHALVDVRLEIASDLPQSVIVAVASTVADNAASDRRGRGTGRDFLTALPSRAALERRLAAAPRKARRHDGRFAVMFIDLDRFKCVNDSCGHRTGDRVLLAVSRRLVAALRPDDFVARYGGDEFIAIIDRVDSAEEVAGIAERVRERISEPIDVNGHRVRVSASIGVAIGDARSSPSALVDDADRSMYRAKQLSDARATEPSAPIAILGT